MQEKRCRDAGLAAGAMQVVALTDASFSGSSIERRPALQEMLTRIGEFDAIVVWKLDRLSRSVRHWSNLMHKLGEGNVDFLSRVPAVAWGPRSGASGAGLSRIACLSERADIQPWKGTPRCGRPDTSDRLGARRGAEGRSC